MAANSSAAGPSDGVPPPARNESKRERKRQLLQDRIQQLTDNFSRGRESVYREQLQKIQLDTTLIMRVDPYVDRPLDALANNESDIPLQNTDPETAKTLLNMAGPQFRDWKQDVEDLMEERDYEINKQKREYDAKLEQHRNVYNLKIQQAKREHAYLSSTVRDRLINTITAKKFRLNKEKEALEISDASALLLHPNQFSINNPASPGGTHGKRTTRLRREIEEMPGFSENKKRKRNGNDEDGSPAPQRRAMDANGVTPVWHNDRLRYGKLTGPVYSIDKLFTDKELSMASNNAALAAHRYMLRHKTRDGQGSSPSDSGQEGGEDDADGELVQSSAPAMERQISHATRSTRGAHNGNFHDNKATGVEFLGSLEHLGNLERLDAAMEPRLPPFQLQPYNKAKPMTDASGPAPLGADEVVAEMQAMAGLGQYEQNNGAGSNFDSPKGLRRLLEVMTQTRSADDKKYSAILQGPRPKTDILADLNGATSNVRAASTNPSSHQTNAGEVAMSRQGSTRGRRRG